MHISDLEILNKLIEYLNNDIPTIIKNDQVFKFINENFLSKILNEMEYTDNLSLDNKKELLQFFIIIYRRYNI